MFASRTSLRPADVAIRAAIVGLVLATGYIHYTLGGLLFTLNAAGYAVAAVAMIVPLALAVRFRWVVRIGLIGYAATAIVAWAVMGPYFTTAYIAKAIEVALIVLRRRRLRPPRRQPRLARSPRGRLVRLARLRPPRPARRPQPDLSTPISWSHRHEAPDPHSRHGRPRRCAGRLFRRLRGGARAKPLSLPEARPETPSRSPPRTSSSSRPPST